MPDLGFGTSYKDGLCPKLEKNPTKPKLGPQNVLQRILNDLLLLKIHRRTGGMYF